MRAGQCRKGSWQGSGGSTGIPSSSSATSTQEGTATCNTPGPWLTAAVPMGNPYCSCKECGRGMMLPFIEWLEGGCLPLVRAERAAAAEEAMVAAETPPPPPRRKRTTRSAVPSPSAFSSERSRDSQAASPCAGVAPNGRRRHRAQEVSGEGRSARNTAGSSRASVWAAHQAGREHHDRDRAGQELGHDLRQKAAALDERAGWKAGATSSSWRRRLRRWLSHVASRCGGTCELES